MIVKHSFAPVNNTRLAHVCGAMDANLGRIQTELSVKIQRRGADFKIEGYKANAQRALTLLQALYEVAAKPISAERVQLMLSGNELTDEPEAIAMPASRSGDVKPRSDNQAHYLKAIQEHDICFGIGPAGSGKTFLAVACAVDALARSAVQRIVLTRPAVEAGERLGFLPGDLSQKVDPYLRPLYDALNDLMGFERVQRALERGQIEIAPLAFMRGRTLNHAFVILDEAQNTSQD
jgi:phosphate starvation-inducible protein PhoH and related proteins